MVKKCSIIECNNLARAKYDKCIKHGGYKKCNNINCNTSARLPFDKCKKHGGGKRCSENDCTKSAIDKYDKCIKHGGGKRCNEKNCNKGAEDNTDKCVKHGGGKRCNEVNCKKSAKSPSDKCVKHGGGKRCIILNCNSGASGSTLMCKKHGGGKICSISNCKTAARLPSDKCLKHGGGIKCPNCIYWIDSRYGRNEYDNYCITCFKHLFPNDKRSIKKREKSKELKVRNKINENFEGFIHDTKLYTGNCDCTHRRRVDHRKLIGNTIIAIETDENAHKNYDNRDEELRYDDLYMIHSGKWIYIRFNPDLDKSKTDIEDKLDILINVIQKSIQRINNDENKDLVEIIKLYY